MGNPQESKGLQPSHEMKGSFEWGEELGIILRIIAAGKK
jgi:hypothetical protein